MKNKKIRILGIRGVPSAHGGFETFAEYLSLYLFQRGWDVTVYCQEVGDYPISEDYWRGIRRVRIPVKQESAFGTIIFDWLSTLHAIKEQGLVLTLGYNTAIFCILYRLKGIKNIINMDGIEWKRDKWSKFAKTWFWINERLACWIASHLIADNPGIATHLATRVSSDKISMIAYGSEFVDTADSDVLIEFGVKPGEYLTLIARIEPENSVLEIVRAFSRCPRGKKLLVLGKFESTNPYHKAILDAASDEVSFVGAIYDKAIVQALRYYSALYLHGHTAGGSNPSLIEALGCGNPVLAHDNQFNRWVTDNKSQYFVDEKSCDEQLEKLLNDLELQASMSDASRIRHGIAFTWNQILEDYEELLIKWC